MAPIGAIEKLLEKTGWSADSVDLFEINEAFAMVTMLTMQALNLPHEKVNIYGGACAQGHPIGSTGSRLIVTLAHAMQQQDKQTRYRSPVHWRRRSNSGGAGAGVASGENRQRQNQARKPTAMPLASVLSNRNSFVSQLT